MGGFLGIRSVGGGEGEVGKGAVKPGGGRYEGVCKPWDNGNAFS